jgi:hypothetical protein
VSQEETVERATRTGPLLPDRIEARALQVLKATCLLGFPLILVLIDVTGVHPSLIGRTGAEQIEKLATSATRWAQVHAAFAVAGFLALGTMLTLRGLIAGGSSHLPADVAATFGAIGAVLFTGTVIMEVLVIPQLSAACVAADPCLDPANLVFTEELADQGWRVLPGLVWGGQGIALGLLLLAALGGRSGALRLWEALLIGAGGFYELVAPTGLHRWGTFSAAVGFPGITGLLVLAGNAGVALRLFRREGAGPSGSQLHSQHLVDAEVGSLEVDDRPGQE